VHRARRLLEQHRRALPVLRHAVADRVLGTEIVLSLREALLGRLPVPAGSLLRIPGHATPAGVHDAEVVLSLGETLLGRLSKPAHRFGVVAAGVVWSCVTHSEQEGGAGIATLGAA
jgi:hypothetical protein